MVSSHIFTFVFLASSISSFLASPAPSEPSPYIYFPDEKTLGYAGPTQCELLSSWNACLHFIDRFLTHPLSQTKDGAEPSLIENPIQPVLNSYFPILNFNLNQSTAPSNHSQNYTHDGETQPLIYGWGNLSPMYSLPPKTFSIEHGPAIPPDCEIKQVHLLHRHGARYPTTSSALPAFGRRMQALQAKPTFRAKGPLDFLNKWSYQLGAEVLTPFGRSQMHDLGVSYRQRYGILLKKMSGRRPVFRTTTQDRMYKSAVTFAAGFFGIPYDHQYHQSILIEHKAFNNSLASYYTCPNSDKPGIGDLGSKISAKWAEIYLQSAVQRLNQLVDGYKFDASDLYTMQQLCSYETVAFGTSSFCSLFDEGEWLDYAYAIDLNFWYSSSFGNPTSAAVGLGYVQELLARLTGQRLPLSPSSVNTTLYNDPHTFPVDQPIYVDATHDTVISSIVVALNLTTLASRGPLSTAHRDPNRSFKVEQIAPFGAQIATQVLSCPVNGTSQELVRIVLNDAVVPLSGLGTCGSDPVWGMCSLENLVRGLKARVSEIEFNKACFGNYTYQVPPGGGGLVNGQIV